MKALKTKFFSLIVISVVLLLNGCTEPVDFDGTETATENQFILDFDALNVIKRHEMTLFPGEIVDVKIIKEKGILDIKVYTSDNQMIYQGDDVSSCEFSIPINDLDMYWFNVNGQKASGYVSFIVREK
ncbi:MAG: hypothetical protein H6Q25_233 [Bacteroidetes bacterium]|nr:hypothetical protein [Bacteroidota bacterium]